MKNLGNLFLLALLGSAAVAHSADARTLSPTPPMGWNNWDSYGLTIGEADYRANAKVLASLRKHGWSYAVIDMGWYMANPFGADRVQRDFAIDANGRVVPTAARYPSASSGAGFKPLADWVHSLGLKFGFHIMRGIPRGAVEKNSPIEGSHFFATEAADQTDVCGWDDSNYGIRDNEAGQAYYDSLFRLYAQWGVDFVKVDCIADHPYKPAEIRQIARAIAKSGRSIVLSLSPGPTHIDHADEIGRYGQMWRISNDIWDGWHFDSDPKYDGFPSGVDTAFDNLAKWSHYSRPGAWPDADMLPLGSLRPHPGWGEPRASRLTHEEQRTQLTLWAIGRSPLMLGGNLTELDEFTRSLITNDRVIAINQTAWDSHPGPNLPDSSGSVRVWLAKAGPRSKPVRYVALFNLKNEPELLTASWKQLGLEGRPSAIELWSGAKIARAASFNVALPAHGAVVYQLR